MSNSDESKQVTLAQAVKDLAANMPAMLEHDRLMARLIRAKYLALVEQGFTEAQALTLCAKS